MFTVSRRKIAVDFTLKCCEPRGDLKDLQISKQQDLLYITIYIYFPCPYIFPVMRFKMMLKRQISKEFYCHNSQIIIK